MSENELHDKAFKIVGIKTRTSNQDEMNGAGRIGALWGRFYADKISEKIPGPLTSEVLSVYHDYESDSSGKYSVMLGMRIAAEAAVPEGLDVLQIPRQKYKVFRCDLGPMPDVIIKAWQSIWALEKANAISRKYSFDIELYPEDPAAGAQIFIAVNEGQD